MPPKRRPPRRLSKPMGDLVAEMYQRGETLQAIQTATGSSGHRIIYRELEARGIPRRGRGNYHGNGVINIPNVIEIPQNDPPTPKRRGLESSEWLDLFGDLPPHAADLGVPPHESWIFDRAIVLLRAARSCCSMSDDERDGLSAAIGSFLRAVEDGRGSC